MGDVQRARAGVAHCRAAGTGLVRGREYRSWCADLALAMHVYAEAAAASGVPVSYRYRDEMRLYSAIARDYRTDPSEGTAGPP